MKQAIFILTLFLTPYIFSQNAPIDFETGGNGASWTWTVFENSTNTTLEIIPNPHATGINTSTTVAKFTALQAGQPWAGCESLHGADIGTFDIDATNSVVKIMVYKTEVSDVGIKFSKPDGWSMGELKVPNTVTNAWEELTFDFSSQVQAGYDQIVIFPDFQTRAQDNIIYFDNITFSEPTAPTEPTVAAPIPTQDPTDVISIFSGTYTDIAGTDFNPNWGQTTAVSFVDIVGNQTMKYETFNYQGTQLDGNQDLSEMEFMHVDVWTPDATVVKTTPISATTGEFLVELTPMNQGSWNSYDIPVSDFTGVSMADIHQLKFDGQAGVNPSTLYIDNIYFWKNSSTPTEPTVAAPIPTQDPADVISIYSGAYTDIPGTDFNPGWGQTTLVSFLDIVGNETMKYETFNYQGTQLDGNQDLSEMEFMHIDVWTPDATVVKTTPISTTTGEFLVELIPMNQGSWNSYDIPVGDFTGVSMADIHQLKFDGQAGVNPSTLYIDNIYFWKNAIIATEPTVAAPIPTQDPADVISIFSDTYTDIPATDFNPNWGQSTVVSFLDIVGNETMKYETFNYQGTQLDGNQDLSEMEFMHIDVWTPNATVVKTTPISTTTGEFAVELTPMNQGSWNSYDIPVGDFTGVSMADIHQLKFDGQAGVNPSTLFIDNIYFWRNATTATEPTVAAPIPTQDPADVISIFSDTYTDIPATDFNPNWGQSTVVSFLDIVGNETMKYETFNYQGTQLDGNQDLSEMEFMHIDVWTPDATVVKTTPISATTGEFAVELTPMNQGSWNSYDIPVGDFTNVSMADIHQLKFDGQAGVNPSTLFIDNIYFWKNPPVVPEPAVAAPTPTQDPGNVISMFSDVYTDVPVDTWLTGWSEGTLEEILVDGNPTKKYADLNFAGVETVGPNLIDASNMTFIHIDFWSPDANDFKIKLVDFGADAAWGGGDDTEHELVFTAPATETWVSYNIPLVLFSNLLNKEHLAQLIFSKAPMGTLYIDNVYFYNPTLATEEFDMIEMNVFPNPTTNLWNFTSNHSIENVLVYDALGKAVISVSPNANEVKISTSSINEGIYFAKIKTASGTTEIKLIKK